MQVKCCLKTQAGNSYTHYGLGLETSLSLLIHVSCLLLNVLQILDWTDGVDYWKDIGAQFVPITSLQAKVYNIPRARVVVTRSTLLIKSQWTFAF